MTPTRPNQARHRTRPSAFRSIDMRSSRVSFALHPRRRAGSVRLFRWTKTRRN